MTSMYKNIELKEVDKKIPEKVKVDMAWSNSCSWQSSDWCEHI